MRGLKGSLSPSHPQGQPGTAPQGSTRCHPPGPSRHPRGAGAACPSSVPPPHDTAEPDFPFGCKQGPASLPEQGWVKEPAAGNKGAKLRGGREEGAGGEPAPLPLLGAPVVPSPGLLLTGSAAPATRVFLRSQRSALSLGSWRRKEVGEERKKKKNNSHTQKKKKRQPPPPPPAHSTRRGSPARPRMLQRSRFVCAAARPALRSFCAEVRRALSAGLSPGRDAGALRGCGLSVRAAVPASGGLCFSARIFILFVFLV